MPQEIKLSSMGKSALSDHPKGSKHLIELEKVTTFFGKLLTPKMTSLKQSLIHQHPNHQANYWNIYYQNSNYES